MIHLIVFFVHRALLSICSGSLFVLALLSTLLSTLASFIDFGSLFALALYCSGSLSALVSTLASCIDSGSLSALFFINVSNNV